METCTFTKGSQNNSDKMGIRTEEERKSNGNSEQSTSCSERIPGDTWKRVQPGISSVSMYATLRIIISSSVEHNWKRSSLDVNNAFVNADLIKELYVAQLEGFINKGMDDYVYSLRKVPCGLKQAWREWYIHLHMFLKELGCDCSDADTTLYLLRNGKDSIFLFIYVDDISIFASGQKIVELAIKRFIAKLEIRI